MGRSKTLELKTGCGNLSVTIVEDKTIFITHGRNGSCSFSMIESIARMINLLLKKGDTLDEIRKQLSGIRCANPFNNGKIEVLSCADAIAKAINIYLER
jgi:ribonucleoside-diphosphate reductase alpha chain